MKEMTIDELFQLLRKVGIYCSYEDWVYWWEINEERALIDIDGSIAIDIKRLKEVTKDL